MPNTPFYPGRDDPDSQWVIPGAGPYPVQQPEQEPPPKRKHTITIVIAVLVAMVLCVIGSLIIGGMAAENKGTLSEVRTAPATEPTTKAPSTTKKKPAGPVTIGDGDWVVGDDVKAGTYKAAGADPGVVTFCTWTVRENDEPGAEIVDFGTSNGTKEPGRVKLSRGQSFETSGCKDWVRQ